MHSQLKYWLAAAHATNITPRHFLQWLSVMPDMESIYTATPEQWLALGINAAQQETLNHPDWAAVEQSVSWIQNEHCHILTLADSNYPQLLKEISDPPLVLFIQGQPSLLSANQIGMVGARAISHYGEKNAFQFAAALSNAGYVITSGLARGVDAASHRGALSARALTIAVTGTGLLHVYPAEHRRLAAEIVEKGGALISEFPLNMTPRPQNFPRRNRIISGLSKGVLVVEAALRSGSLVTARHAVEQGREVFAIPGLIQSPVARGCHALIRQGAKLVETAEDILEEFSLDSPAIQVEFSTPLAIIQQTMSGDEEKLYNHIGSTVTSLDEIILRSGLTAGAVSSILLSLELESHIRSVAGGYVR
jgi:DNA processing protein